MILWTIRTKAEWELLEQTGVLRTDTVFAEKKGFFGEDPLFISSYHWMAKQMRERLPPSGLAEDALPLWGWYQRYGVSRKKPDLRTHEYRILEDMVRIEFKINDDLVLLSDFSLWNYVLQDAYVPSSLTDWNDFQCEVQYRERVDDIPPEHPSNQSIIEKSWEKIFDLELEGWGIASRAEKSIQATFWELYLDQVRDVTEFGSRRKKT